MSSFANAQLNQFILNEAELEYRELLKHSNIEHSDSLYWLFIEAFRLGYFFRART